MAWDLGSFRKNLEFTEKTKGEIRQLFHPYYILNMLLAVSFLCMKLTRPVCEYLFAAGPVTSRRRQDRHDSRLAGAVRAGHA